MKTCSYFYKEHKIGNIDALNDFLLEKLRFEPTLGDMVFSIDNSRQLDAIDRIEKIMKEKKSLDAKYREAKRKADSYGADGELILLMEKPYVGVSEFLSGLRNRDGHLYFPEFIPKNYWSNRFLDWASGKYTLDEIDVFFGGDPNRVTVIPQGNTNDWRLPNGELRERFGSKELLRLRDLMEEKWRHQAQYGTEIHNVLQQFFTKTSKGKYWYELLEDPHSGAMHKANFIANLRAMPQKGEPKITNITTDKVIDDILIYAKDLRDLIHNTYGKHALFYPEFTISANLNKTFQDRNDLKLLGRVDLLVIDEDGIPHIIDYKTSPKTYEDYSTAKKLNFTYLLATYERMLRRWGFNTTNTDITIAPLVMQNFRNVNGVWQYDGVEKGTIEKSPLKSLKDKLSEDYLTQNLDEYMEAPLLIDASAEKTTTKVSEIMSKIFPKYGDINRKTDEEIRQLIEDLNGFQLNKETNRYEFLPKGFSTPIYASAQEGETMLFKRVKDYYTRSKERNINKTSVITKALKTSQKNNLELELPEGMDLWIKSKLSKYCNPLWQVMGGVAGDVAQQFGMILLYNESLDLLEVVKITNSAVKYENNWGPKNTNLFGAHESDIVEDSRSNSLILKAANGNIELMEAMLVLNNLNFNSQVLLGGILIIGTLQTALGLSASNKELLYNWKKLSLIAKNLKIDIDNLFTSGSIKLLRDVEKCNLEFLEILARVNDSGNKTSEYNKFKSALSKLLSALTPNNIEESLIALNELRLILEKNFDMKRDLTAGGVSKHSGIKDYDTYYAETLYQSVCKAILDLNNFNIRQSLKDHDAWIEHLHILNKGLSGSYIDNSGNFGNQLLNLISSLALEGYQNARDIASPLIRKLRLLVEEVKKEVGYSGLLEHTLGNLTSLYKDMTYYDANGNLLFLNPWKDTKGLMPKLIELLKHVILSINKDRYKNLGEALIENKIETNDTEFFQVPIIEGTFASKVSTDGWMGWLKNKLKMFKGVQKGDFTNLKNYFRDKQTEFFSEEEERSSKDAEIFKTVNLMDLGNGPRRIDIINEKRKLYGEGFFERDLERILSTHTWAYATQQALQDRMPLIKAAYVSLVAMGNDQNTSFSQDEKFLREFVQNRINHQSIVNDKFKTLKGVLGTVLKIASWMALAFSPVQMSYQTLEGFWKDIKLMVTKPDGTETFTFNNMKAAAKIVYNELFHYSDKDTVCTAINSQYGINDMDNVAFAENNTSNKHGLFNFFGKFAYKFSSRPDFYNRMTIFVSLMMHDGCWEAHSINQTTGELEYDWEKDARFKAYANDMEGKNGKSEEWYKAKALYYTVASLLIEEGAKNKSGSVFKIGDPLPKAYSNKESEAKKAVGDTLYGYYDSTKKSLMLSTLLGGMMMQMRTYWSAKKNQYLAPGGIKALGKWIHAELEVLNLETGNTETKKLYYALDENGEIDVYGPLVYEDDPKCSKTPFLRWEGKFEEGILVTLWGIAKQASKTSIKDAWNSYYHNTDENLRKTYQSNIHLFLCDFVMLLAIGGAALLLGDWADDVDKEAKKSGHLDDALAATLAGLASKTVYNSSLDLAWWSSIFSVSMDWNPFVVSYVSKEASVLGNFLTGDQTFNETLVKSFSAARQMRPIFTFLDLEE